MKVDSPTSQNSLSRLHSDHCSSRPTSVQQCPWYINHENLIGLHHHHCNHPRQLLQNLMGQSESKPDILRSSALFGNMVEQLCDHLEAAAAFCQPVAYKFVDCQAAGSENCEWVRHLRGQEETTLRMPIDPIVADACEVNVIKLWLRLKFKI